MLVTLGEDSDGVEVFSAGPKKGSFFQAEFAAAAGGGGAGGGAAGRGESCRPAFLKSWVKLPSADAESDVPGEENPLDFDGPAGGGAGRNGSSAGRDDDAWGGVFPETKMRVNSPAPCSGGGCGPLTTWVLTFTPGEKGCCGGASRDGDGGGVAGRCPMELKICVNSPGSAAGAGDVAGAGRFGAALAGGDGGTGAKGSGALGASWRSVSKAFRNMAVAVKGSASGSGPELGFLFVMEGGPDPRADTPRTTIRPAGTSGAGS